MTFKPRIWYPIAAVLSVVNLIAAGFAAAQAEPWHATLHAGLALAFGLWAQRLRQQGAGGGDIEARLEALEAELGELGAMRRELSEIHERLDFAERMLAQGQEVRRVSPEH